MAQTGYTPILIYSSSTTSNVPAAGSLTNSTLGSELAINITDGKLFYKDNANAVQVIGWKTTPTTAGGTGLTSYTAGDLLYYASGTALTKLAIGVSGRWLGSSGTAPQWNAPAALTKTDDTNVTLTLGGSASTALLNAASITVGWTGTLATTRGGTGLSSFTANGVVYASSTSALSTSSNFQFDGASVGIGIAPGTYLLNVAGSVNSTTSLNVNNTGTTSNILFASSGQTGTTPRSNIVARIQSTAAGRDVNIQLSDNVANAAEVGMVGGRLYLATGGSERVSVFSGGGVSIGSTNDPGAGNLEVQSASNTEGNLIAQFRRSGQITTRIYTTNGTDGNTAATGERIAANGATSRAINAGGTVNASGADYAEYMTKNGNFVIAKGDICGIDADGKLTNKFDEAISFVIKSTNPSYVGGDEWGVGIEDETQLEQVRQTVDRIAFSGQVPVNVLGAAPGQYIVPVENNDGIGGIAKNEADMTFAEYMKAVGKVIAIETDGRARVIVKVS